MNWAAIALFALAGFLIGGVVSLERSGVRVGAIVCGIFALAAATGGVLWLL